MTHYASINESIRLWVTTDVSAETKSALATFCRRNGFAYLYFEILEPMLSRTDLILALATTERPWPPKGIGSQTIEAVGIAMIGSEGRAYLTPVLTDLKHATNLGLASAVTKQLLETLRDRNASSAGYLVRQGDLALERALAQSGFGKSDLQVATEYAEYLEYSSTPQKILEALGLNGVRLGDVLALAFDGRELDRLNTYKFTLDAGLAPYLSDQIRYAPLLLGLIDLIAASPPGGVPPGSVAPLPPGGGGPVVDEQGSAAP
jgi:hypothetical protein